MHCFTSKNSLKTKHDYVQKEQNKLNLETYIHVNAFCNMTDRPTDQINCILGAHL